MAFKFVVFVALIAVALAWPFDRQYYDEPEGGYQRSHGGYGRPSYGNEGGYGHQQGGGYGQQQQQQQGGYARPNGGYGRPHGGYGRPSNVDNTGGDNWQGQGSQGWQGPQQQGGGGFHQQPQSNQGPIPSSPFGGRFDGSSAAESQPQPNPSTFGERLGGPTSGNNFPPQVNVEPTNKVAVGVKTFGGAGTPPPTSDNAPLDPNIDLTGSRVFHNDGISDSASASSSPDASQPQQPSSGPSEEGTSSNGEDLTGLPRGGQAQQPSQDSSVSESHNTSSSGSSGPLFGGAQPGEGTQAADSSSSSSSGNERVTIDPSATADSGLVLG